MNPASAKASAGPTSAKASVGLVFRILIAVGLTAWIVYKSHPGDIAGTLRSATWPGIAVALLLLIPDRVLMAYRWIALLGPIGARRPRFSTILRIFLVSTFVGTFLPGSVGGDAARAWSLTREGVPAAESLASVMLDRLLGVVAIFLSAAIGLALAPDLLGDAALTALLAVTGAACAFALAVVFSTTLDDWLRRIVRRWAPAAIQRTSDKLLDALQAYRTAHGMLAWVLVASVGVQVIRVLQAYALGRSLGIEAPLLSYFAFVPIIVLAMQAPVSIAGLGVGQLGFVWCFRRVDVPDAAALALSVLFIALGVVGSLPGAIPYVWGRRRQ